MHQLVNEPTRDQNILDHVPTTDVDLINNVVVGEHFSDHNSITFTLNCAPYLSRISKKFIYTFNKADWSHLTSLFQNTPWDFVLSDLDLLQTLPGGWVPQLMQQLKKQADQNITINILLIGFVTTMKLSITNKTSK